MKLSKILVATDFSDGSQPAMAHAIRAAKEHRAELVIAHVWGAPSPASEAERLTCTRRELAAMDELRKTHGARELARLLADVRAEGVRARIVLAEGSPARKIVALARQEQVELVVTGARGASDTSVFVVGSVTEGIVRRCATNVLVARGPAAPYHRILLATDLADASLAVVPMASAFASPDADVELMHVVDWGDRPPPIHGSFGSPQSDFKSVWRTAVEEAERELLRIVDCGGHGHVRHSVVDGLPAVEILRRVQQGGHDLLVVGKHAAVLPAHQRVAERLMRHAPCSVLVTRRLPATQPRAVPFAARGLQH
jgi:nucleotide-binding universal stress UspA family protein